MVSTASEQSVAISPSRWLCILAAMLIAVLAYSVGLSGPLFFDDLPNVVANELVAIDGTTAEQWRTAILGSSAGRLSRGVAMFTFAVNHVATGEFSALSLKAVNLALHCVAAFLIYRVVVLVLRAPALDGWSAGPRQRQTVALLAAGIWLLHPLHVSTVLYAVQRMAQLSTLFTLAGLWVFLHYRLRWVRQAAPVGELLACLFWGLWFGLLAVYSKENGVLLPWLVVVVEVSLFGGIWAGQPRPQLERAAIALLCAPVLAVGIWYLLDPQALQGLYAKRDFTLEERVLTQLRVLWMYVYWLVWPDIHAMGFFHDDVVISRSWWEPLTTLLAAVGWVVLIVLSWRWQERFPLALFAVLFFLVAQSLESSVIVLDLVYEHRNYLPSLGICLLLAFALSQLCDRLGGVSLGLIGSMACLLLSVLLLIRSYAWRDDMSLATFNVASGPLSPRANFYAGVTLFDVFQVADQSAAPGDTAHVEHLLKARDHFLQMHKVAPEDLAAPVMLYQIDTVYFPRLAQRHDWLGVLASRASLRRLQRSDQSALGALVNFVLSPVGAQDAARVDAMLEQWLVQRPADGRLLGHRFRLLRNAGDDAEIVAMLERALAHRPGHRQAAAYLAQHYGGQDLGKTYDALVRWMANDPRRIDLAQIHQVFVP